MILLGVQVHPIRNTMIHRDDGTLTIKLKLLNAHVARAASGVQVRH